VTAALVILFVASAGFLIYGRWARVHLLPTALRYLPPETDVLVGVGDLASVWNGIDLHFKSVLQETDRKGFLATELEEIRTNLLKKRISIDRKEDLTCRYGIDLDRGVLAGFILHDLSYSVVIPVADQAAVDRHCSGSAAQASSEKKLVGFLCSLDCPGGTAPVLLRYQDKPEGDPCKPSILFAEGSRDRSWLLEDHAYAVGHRFLVFPRPDTAILSNSCELLSRGLADQERNLAFARADDALFEAVHGQLRRPLLSGPGALLVARGFSNPTDFDPVGRIAASIDLKPDAVVGDLRLRTTGANARVVEGVVAASRRERAWRDFFDEDDAAVLVFRDDSLPRYIDLAGNEPELAAELATFMGGILEPARRLDNLQQIVLGCTDYRDGLPMLVLGLWGSRDELAQLVSTTQSRLRHSRNQKILEGARQKNEEAKIRPEDLGPQRFNGSDYLETYGGYQIRYLEPRVTRADLTYRLPLKPDEGGNLLENRYRLASVMTGDILWIGTGRQQLVRLIDRLNGTRTPAFPLGGEQDRRSNKLRVLANTGTLVRIGMLSGESWLQFLLDFRYHREIIASLEPTGNGQELRLEFVAHRRAGSDAPVR